MGVSMTMPARQKEKYQLRNHATPKSKIPKPKPKYYRKNNSTKYLFNPYPRYSDEVAMAADPWPVLNPSENLSMGGDKRPSTGSVVRCGVSGEERASLQGGRDQRDQGFVECLHSGLGNELDKQNRGSQLDKENVQAQVSIGQVQPSQECQEIDEDDFKISKKQLQNSGGLKGQTQTRTSRNWHCPNQPRATQQQEKKESNNSMSKQQPHSPSGIGLSRVMLESVGDVQGGRQLDISDIIAKGAVGASNCLTSRSSENQCGEYGLNLGQVSDRVCEGQRKTSDRFYASQGKELTQSGKLDTLSQNPMFAKTTQLQPQSTTRQQENPHRKRKHIFDLTKYSLKNSTYSPTQKLGNSSQQYEQKQQGKLGKEVDDDGYCLGINSRNQRDRGNLDSRDSRDSRKKIFSLSRASGNGNGGPAQDSIRFSAESEHQNQLLSLHSKVCKKSRHKENKMKRICQKKWNNRMTDQYYNTEVQEKEKPTQIQGKPFSQFAPQPRLSTPRNSLSRRKPSQLILF